MVEAVIFDFDGVIADSARSAYKVTKEVAQKLGYKFDKPMEFYRDMTTDQLLEHLKVSKLKAAVMVGFLRKKIYSNGVKTVPGMDKAINDLPDVKLILFSANKKKYVVDFLKKHDLHDKFDHVLTGVPIFGKTNRLKSTLRKLDLKPGKVIYVGDEDVDIHASKHVGVTSVASTWGYSSKKVLEGLNPDYIAKSPADIAKIVKKLKNEA